MMSVSIFSLLQTAKKKRLIDDVWHVKGRIFDINLLRDGR